MPDLESVSPDRLRRALEEAASAKAAKRLLVALAYVDDVPVSTIVDRYGIPRSTVYHWLDRFETHSIEEAIADDARPGRPPALTPAERDELQSILEQDPRSIGYEADSWTSNALRRYIEDEYGVSYSDAHVRRLRNELVAHRER